MNKKILIASIFATLMLLIPINSVVGVSNDYSISNMNNEPRPELIIDVYGGFGITSIIRNVGDADAKNAKFYIGIFGGIILSKNTYVQHLDDISPGESVKIRFRYFGIALFEDIPVGIVKVWGSEVGHYETNVNAWILFNLVILR